jgi:hypothetical protein
MRLPTGPKNKGKVFQDNYSEITREWDFWPKNSPEETLQKKYEKIQQIHHQEEVIFNQKNEQTKAQIKNTLEKIKISVQPVKSFLDKETDKNLEQTLPTPGVYHLNFFERIKQAIDLFKKRTENASTWLEVFNQRSAKKRGYWPKAISLGTKFSQSAERYVATSVG